MVLCVAGEEMNHTHTHTHTYTHTRTHTHTLVGEWSQATDWCCLWLRAGEGGRGHTNRVGEWSQVTGCMLGSSGGCRGGGGREEEGRGGGTSSFITWGIAGPPGVPCEAVCGQH